MDKARRQTNKRLKVLERRVKRFYANNPSLKRIQGKYDIFMKGVAERTAELYAAYQNADDETKAEAKKAYIDEVRRLTTENPRYRALMNEFATVMSRANQEALDMVNAEMPEIYIANYNQVAVTCKKVGIKVDE